MRACSLARGAAESKEERARVTPGQRRRERRDDGWESRGRSRIRAARACISGVHRCRPEEGGRERDAQWTIGIMPTMSQEL